VFEPAQLDGPVPWWRDVFGHPADAPVVAPA
jgi:hypothetical protein